jgi:hypothetical protein
VLKLELKIYGVNQQQVSLQMKVEVKVLQVSCSFTCSRKTCCWIRSMSWII